MRLELFGKDPATTKGEKLVDAEHFVQEIEKSFSSVVRPYHINAHLRWVIKRNQTEYQPQYFREHIRQWGTFPAGAD